MILLTLSSLGSCWLLTALESTEITSLQITSCHVYFNKTCVKMWQHSLKNKYTVTVSVRIKRISRNWVLVMKCTCIISHQQLLSPQSKLMFWQFAVWNIQVCLYIMPSMQYIINISMLNVKVQGNVSAGVFLTYHNVKICPLNRSYPNGDFWSYCTVPSLANTAVLHKYFIPAVKLGFRVVMILAGVAVTGPEQSGIQIQP